MLPEPKQVTEGAACVEGYLGGIDEGAGGAGPAAEPSGLLCCRCCSFWGHPPSTSLQGEYVHLFSRIFLYISHCLQLTNFWGFRLHSVA